jgi:hypothetical protein
MAKFPSVIDRVAARFLNDVNDASIGGNPAPFLISQPVGGQLGDIAYLSAAMAAQMSDAAVGTLFEGLYMYVQMDPAAVATGTVRGGLTFWKDFENYIVGIDAPTVPNLSMFSGVALNVVSKGNYGWVQVSGKASVQFAAVVTDATAGDLVIVDQTPGKVANTLADATAVLTKMARSVIGVAINAPANNTISLVLLKGGGGPSYL